MNTLLVNDWTSIETHWFQYNLWEKSKYAILVIIITCYIHAGSFVLFKPRPHLVSVGSPITGQTMKPRH